DIQVNNVARDIAFAKLRCQLPNHRLRRMAPAAMVVTECPAWWQQHGPQQHPYTLTYLLRCRPVDHVIIELTTLSLHPPDAGLLRPKVKAAVPGVIEE